MILTNKHLVSIEDGIFKLEAESYQYSGINFWRAANLAGDIVKGATTQEPHGLNSVFQQIIKHFQKV
jgi:hypothetical protein